MYYSNGTINWVRTTDLNNGILDSCEIQITPKAVLDYNLSIIPQESICIAMYGGGGTIGKHSIIRFDTTINQSVCAIHPNFVCNMEYVHIFMQYQRHYWMDYAAGSRKDPNINQIIIKNCLIPIPPKKEQDRIVSKYNALFPLIDNYSEANEQRRKLNDDIASTLKKSILQEAIQGRLVAQDNSDEPASALLQRIKEEKQRLVKEGKLKKKDVVDSVIFKGDDNRYYEKVGKNIIDVTDDISFDIPNSWVWCRLREICDDFIVPQRDKPTRFDGNIPWCRIEDIEGKYLNKSLSGQNVSMELIKEMNMHICPIGTVISACSASIGSQAIVTQECCTNQTFIGIVCNSRILYNEFLYYFWTSQKEELKKKAKGTTIGYISRKKYEDYLFPLPPLAEQKRIVEKIEQIFNEIKGN